VDGNGGADDFGGQFLIRHFCAFIHSAASNPFLISRPW
jgi:hypothetical protein